MSFEKQNLRHDKLGKMIKKQGILTQKLLSLNKFWSINAFYFIQLVKICVMGWIVPQMTNPMQQILQQVVKK